MITIFDFILVIFLLVLGMLVFIIVKKWKDIHSFFFPQMYAEVTMLESDNNVTTWIQKKDSNLRFKFNDGYYNLFETASNIIPTSDGGRLVKSPTTIYRSGRLAKFFYVEGDKNPIDFRNMKVSSNARLDQEMLKLELSKLWEEPKTPFMELWEKIQPFVMIGGIVLVLVVILSQKKGG